MYEQEIGVVSHYYGKLSVGIIDLKEPLKVGDTIHVKGAHDDFTQKVESMQIEHDKIEEGKAGEAVGIKVAKKVHPNDKVYKVVS